MDSSARPEALNAARQQLQGNAGYHAFLPRIGAAVVAAIHAAPADLGGHRC